MSAEGPEGERRPRVLPAGYVTDGVPGIGGRLKARPEDFLVDEQPLYLPCGEGEHVYLYIEKRQMSTFELIGLVAKHFRVGRSAVGHAGLKDKQAVTRQLLSVHVPGRSVEDFGMIQHARVRVEWADMHTNKLRPGQLKGNRFVIRVRDVSPTAALNADRALRGLMRTGVPNRYGEQRFGAVWRNHLVGAAHVVGDWKGVCDGLLSMSAVFADIDAESREAYDRGEYARAFETMPRAAATERRVLRVLADGGDFERAAAAVQDRELTFFQSAMQSAVFNEVLDRRLTEGRLSDLGDGDVAWKHDNGSLFDVDGEALGAGDLDARLARFEVSPSGPLWGPQMKRARGGVDDVELASLREFGLTPPDLERADAEGRLFQRGSRRPLRVALADVEVEGGMDEHGGYVKCAFDLPPGSFATVVMREVMKTDLIDPAKPELGRAGERFDA
ncbi:MAG: tRNA pseudouridine(13) synthase TruD [Planctomycetota bacterium]